MNPSNETPEIKVTIKEDTSLGKRRLTDNFIVVAFITLLLLILGQILGAFTLVLPFWNNTDAGNTASFYFVFIGIWVVTLLYLRFTKKNRPILKAIGTKTAGNTWGKLLLGFLIGFVLNGVCVLAAWLHRDISLVFYAFQPVSLILVFLSVFIQSSAEELICRGFLYQRLMRSYHRPAIAVIGNSLLFAVLHLFNDGVTILSLLNIFIVGVFFSLMVYYMDSLWCAFAAHAMWNFTQNIIFGLPNSGIVVPLSIFKLDAGAAQNSFAYNTGFGIEGTLLANGILILSCVCIYLWGKRKGKKPTDIWA
ncbi:CPBP family intramembrane metalloprotease [bacterium 1XD21-13]|nr:CPBP family intramembrane metalloprotease [bacterium 1XD21-13]